MAGLAKVNEEVPVAQQGLTWIKPRQLLDWDQEFCLIDLEQNSFNQSGAPQYTLQVLFVREGQVCERAFNMTVNKYREIRYPYYQKHLPLHKLHLIEIPNKNKTFSPIIDLEDVPGSVDDGKCACNEYGVINPNDPTTWTEHYRLSVELNDYLTETGQKPMDTGALTVEMLQRMVKMMGVA